MKALLLVTALALASGQSYAQDSPWTTTDTAMQVAVTTTLLLDWHQTREVQARRAEGYRELNPLIGQSPRAINTYFAGAIIGSALLSWSLPQPWRSRVQAGTIGLELVVIGRNKSIGLRVGF